MLLDDWNVFVEIVVFLVLDVGPAVPWSLLFWVDQLEADFWIEH